MPRSGAAIRSRARGLRAGQTRAELKLWRNLKRLPLADSHFRKQVAIEPYVVDFVCFAARLIVEVDGEQHGFQRQRRHDDERTRWLERQGFSVLRFWNRDVLRSIDDVLATIYAALPGELLICNALCNRIHG